MDLYKRFVGRWILHQESRSLRELQPCLDALMSLEVDAFGDRTILSFSFFTYILIFTYNIDCAYRHYRGDLSTQATRRLRLREGFLNRFNRVKRSRDACIWDSNKFVFIHAFDKPIEPSHHFGCH